MPKSFHVGPGWKFVTGKLEDIRAINAKLGERMRNLTDHRNEIVLGNDATGEWTRDNMLGRPRPRHHDDLVPWIRNGATSAYAPHVARERYRLCR